MGPAGSLRSSPSIASTTSGGNFPTSPSPNALDAQHGIFVAIAERDAQGRMVWRWVWDGNGSEAGGARHQRALRCNAYARMVEALRHGRRSVQADLILRLGLTPAHLPPANPGASAAAVGHPGKGKCDACLFLSTPARRLCRAGLACFRRLPC